MASDLTTDDGTTPATSSTTAGATITSIYVERSVRTYAIPEHELDSIGLLNNQVALWSSLGTGFVFLVLSCIWDFTSAQEPLPDKATNMAYLFGGIAIVCYVSAGLHYWAKRNRITKIKQSAGGEPSKAREIVGPSAMAFRRLFAAIAVILLLSTIQSGVEAISAASAGNIGMALLYLVGLSAVALVLWYTRSVD